MRGNHQAVGGGGLEGQPGDYQKGKYGDQSQIDSEDREQSPPRIVFLGVIYNCSHAPIFADSKIPPSTPGTISVTYLDRRLKAKGLRFEPGVQLKVYGAGARSDGKGTTPMPSIRCRGMKYSRLSGPPNPSMNDWPMPSDSSAARTIWLLTLTIFPVSVH